MFFGTALSKTKISVWKTWYSKTQSDGMPRFNWLLVYSYDYLNARFMSYFCQ